MAPRSLCQIVGRQFCAEAAVADAMTRARATVMRYMFFVSNLVEYLRDPVKAEPARCRIRDRAGAVIACDQ
jgi:hypothetical protein